MAVEHRALLRFMMLYSALFSFGLASPFLPAILAGRGLGPEEIGLVLGAATALRLVCGPIAGRLADRFHTLRAELAVCAILAAAAALLYLAAHELWSVMAVSLFQAAALAPLVPLADALSLLTAAAIAVGSCHTHHGECPVEERGWWGPALTGELLQAFPECLRNRKSRRCSGEIRVDHPFRQRGAIDHREDRVHSTFFPLPVVAVAGSPRAPI